MEYICENNTRTSGVFITFEGGEGVGKTTHIRFLAEVLQEQGCEVLRLREPGGTTIGESLRDIVLDTDNEALADETELFIYEAARAQIVKEIILPALERGAIVLCDRFCDSTVAYQAYGRGLDKEFVKAANAFASQGVVPDRTIYMTCGKDVTEGLQRATHHGLADRLEQAGIDFHMRVKYGFEEIAKENPQRICHVESSDKKSITAQRIFKALTDVFPWMENKPYSSSEFFDRINEKYYGDKHASLGQSSK